MQAGGTLSIEGKRIILHGPTMTLNGTLRLKEAGGAVGGILFIDATHDYEIIADPNEQGLIDATGNTLFAEF